MENAIIHRWKLHVSQEITTAWVLPDGCRDVILRVSDQSDPHAFLTGLDERAMQADLRPGETLYGLRLAPGAGFDRRLLKLEDLEGKGPRELMDQLAEGILPTTRQAAEALSFFAASPKDLRRSARRLGVSERTLRRTVSDATGWSPSRWIQLARVRTCAKRLLDGRDPLADIALECGYSDQAHMTREARRWFLFTPGELRRRDEWRFLLFQPGFT